MRCVAVGLLLVLAVSRGVAAHEDREDHEQESAWDEAASAVRNSLTYDATPVIATGLGSAATAVPEPPGWAVFAVGFAGVAYAMRRRFITQR